MSTRRVGWIVFILLGLVAVGAPAEEREIPLPPVTLVQPPDLPKLKPVPLSEERQAEIHELIRELAKVKEATHAPLHWQFSGTLFVPVGKFGPFYTREPAKDVLPAVRRLIEIGPDAVPQLLEALEDATETEYVQPAFKTQLAIPGGMTFDPGLQGNPLNPTEQDVLRLGSRFATPRAIPPLRLTPNDLESYRVRVGDVCFAILGQIVSRQYVCLALAGIKDAGCRITSPVQSKKTRGQLRQIWKTKNPRQRVFESLLVDYSMRGIEGDDYREGFSIAAGFQMQAAMRLLYYYPEESADLIAKRIEGLNVSGDFSEAEDQDAIRADAFIEAVSWSKSAKIQAALAAISKKAKRTEVIEALERAGIRKGKE